MDAELPTSRRSPRAECVWLVSAFTLLLIAFAPTLRDLVQVWLVRDEYSHGFLMPLVALWVLWEQRDRWRALEPRASFLGPVLLLPSLAALLVSEMRIFMWLGPYAFVGAVLGVLLAFYGRRVLRPAFPVVIVLLLMCPLPGRVQDALTVPLRHTAAVLATGMLDLSGVPASLEGNLIRVPGIDDLWVADACSGIRSFISLLSLSVLVCLFWNRSWWVKLAVIASAAPIAVFVNGLRIWLTGVLSVKLGPEAAHGFFHDFEGVLLFAFAGLLLVGWIAALGYLFPAKRGPAAA